MILEKKNIVIIGPAHPYRGGIADTNEAMCRAFNRAGHNAQLVTFSVQYPNFLFPGKSQFSSEIAPEGLVIHRWINSMNPFNWMLSARKINALNPDVVIIRYWLPMMGPCLGSIARLLKTSIKIIAITDNVIPHEKRLMDTTFTSYFMGGCHGFMALSSSVKKDLESLTEKPSSFFPHPINDQLGDLVERREARTRLGLDLEGNYILFFGFVRKYKGLDLLMEAMADPRMKDANIQLIVAGEFYDDPADYLEQIKRLGLEDRVVLRNDFIPSEEVGNYFCAANLVTQTYRTATQSGITQMALHFEVPVLVTRVGGLDEFVKEGQTGLFASVEPDDIAENIVRFFHEDQDVYSEAIRNEKSRFSWDTFVEQFVLFSKELS